MKSLEDEKRKSATEQLTTSNAELQASVDKLKAVSTISPRSTHTSLCFSNVLEYMTILFGCQRVLEMEDSLASSKEETAAALKDVETHEKAEVGCGRKPKAVAHSQLHPL